MRRVVCESAKCDQQICAHHQHSRTQQRRGPFVWLRHSATTSSEPRQRLCLPPGGLNKAEL